MWGRDKNFQVSMLYELRNYESKKYAREVFAFPPFISSVGSLNATNQMQNLDLAYIFKKYF
jgi:hypothetical protein